MTKDELPFRSIPAPADEYTAGSVLSRYMDGLGFRYYWATEGLTGGDLDYEVCDSSRSIRETLGHVLNIIKMIESALTGDVYELPEPAVDLDLEGLRKESLARIQFVSDQLKSVDPEALAEAKARFRIQGEVHEFPFWNTINGVMSDALYHVGQIVAYRRAAGNPIDQGINVYLGIQADSL